MDRYCNEPALADLRSDPVALAVMDGDGVNPRDVAATLIRLLESAHPPLAQLTKTIDRLAAQLPRWISLIASRTPQLNFRKA